RTSVTFRSTHRKGASAWKAFIRATALRRSKRTPALTSIVRPTRSRRRCRNRNRLLRCRRGLSAKSAKSTRSFPRRSQVPCHLLRRALPFSNGRVPCLIEHRAIFPVRARPAHRKFPNRSGLLVFVVVTSHVLAGKRPRASTRIFGR